MLSGVFKTTKKDGTEYFRASLSYKDKHISLGSFDTEEAAGAAYAFASSYLRGDTEYLPEEYEEVVGKLFSGEHDISKDGNKRKEKEENSREKSEQVKKLDFDKWIMLLNLKKSGMYCKNPIYLYGKYFVYYLDRTTELKFGADQLFFCMNHKLQKRGGRIFYSDYGMQCGLLSRFGVKNYAVEGKDYIFNNGDSLDFRYGNLVVLNKFNGVTAVMVGGRKKYDVKIHLRSDLKVGRYSDEVKAAIAYNKAADRLEEAVKKRKNERLRHNNTTNVENKMLGKQYENGTNCGIFSAEGECKKDYMRRINRKSVNGSFFGKNDQKNANVLDEKIKNQEILKIQEQNQSSKKSDEICENTHKIRIYNYRRWRRNYIEGLSGKEYVNVYEQIDFSKSFRKFLDRM